MNDARSAALKAILLCRKKNIRIAEAVEKSAAEANLSSRDSALCYRIAFGVVQNTDYLDYYISLFAQRPMVKIQDPVKVVLEIGAYQLLFMDRIPVHAAVNEAVELVKANGFGHAKGLVNAVLHRFSDYSGNLPEIKADTPAQYLSIRYSHPQWLCEKLLSLYDYDFVCGFLDSNNAVPTTDLQINLLKTSLAEYCAVLDEASIPYTFSKLFSNCLQVSVNPKSIPGLKEGLVYIQDEAARYASEISDAEANDRVLDCCASPGGKTITAAIKMKNTGEVTSCDINAKKVSKIQENCSRLGISCVKTEIRNAKDFNPDYAEAFDKVICDVPCSGLGTISKHPEIRLKKQEDIAELPEIQKQILSNVSKYVKKGGVLIYSTCTILPEENQQIVDWFLQSYSDFYAEDFGISDIRSKDGMYAFMPNINGTDGFFAARLRRNL